MELKRPLQRSFLSASSAGARLLSYPSPSVVAQHSKTPFCQTLPFVLFTNDKVTFLKEASVEPTPSTPGAICQPGIIRFPRSFNEINNDGEKTRRSNGKGRKGRIISTATREDTTEDSLLFPRQGAFLIYSLAPFTSEKWIQSREPWHMPLRNVPSYTPAILTNDNTNNRLLHFFLFFFSTRRTVLQILSDSFCIIKRRFKFDRFWSLRFRDIVYIIAFRYRWPKRNR